MYPDWPKSDANLVPLSQIDGPKLAPFDFHGPQKMEFLEYIGEGLHSHVVKVKILGQIYALKVFRFVYNEDWLDYELADCEDMEALSALYNYSEPFSRECRAFGRLQETGHEELAVKCYGYMLLDDEHERLMMHQFRDRKLDFNGNIEHPGGTDKDCDMRGRYLGKDRGPRPPPIRGIVKEFGPKDEDLDPRRVRRVLRDVVRLQQLGIINIDVAHRQLINEKFADFSTAITTPHYITTPVLNPRLTPEWIKAMEFDTFQFSIRDYWYFDDMIITWNDEHEGSKKPITVYAFPDGRYDWKTKGSSHVTRRGRVSKARRECTRLSDKPPRWYLDCSNTRAADLKSHTSYSTELSWRYKDGLIFPIKRDFWHKRTGLTPQWYEEKVST